MGLGVILILMGKNGASTPSLPFDRNGGMWSNVYSVVPWREDWGEVNNITSVRNNNTYA